MVNKPLIPKEISYESIAMYREEVREWATQMMRNVMYRKNGRPGIYQAILARKDVVCYICGNPLGIDRIYGYGQNKNKNPDMNDELCCSAKCAMKLRRAMKKKRTTR